MVKNLPAMQETWVQSQRQEDPLEKGMVTHSSLFLPGEFHGWGAWCAAVYGVTESLTRLSNSHVQVTCLATYEMEQTPVTLAPMSSTCLLSVEKLAKE